MRGAKRDALVRRPPAAPRLSASAAPPPADARVAAWPRPRRFNLPALGERKLRRGAPHLSLHTGGGRRDRDAARITGRARCGRMDAARTYCRSEEHTSELQSLMRISYAVFCLKKKKNTKHITCIMT